MITVGLPVFNQTRIMHIALEGLCRQEDTGDWELIISSEDNSVWKVVDVYTERLKNAGCIDVVCDRIKGWIPLPQKWKKIGSMMNESSIGMILQAADCYSHPARINQSKDAMQKEYNWYHESMGYFYYLNKGLLVKYDNSRHKVGTVTHLNMCISGDYAKKLPSCELKSGIDAWMFRTIPAPELKVKQIDKLHSGVDLHGMNNISKKRGRMIEDCRNAFKNPRTSLDKIGLPDDVVTMINRLK